MDVIGLGNDFGWEALQPAQLLEGEEAALREVIVAPIGCRLCCQTGDHISPSPRLLAPNINDEGLLVKILVLSLEGLAHFGQLLHCKRFRRHRLDQIPATNNGGHRWWPRILWGPTKPPGMWTLLLVEADEEEAWVAVWQAEMDRIEDSGSQEVTGFLEQGFHACERLHVPLLNECMGILEDETLGLLLLDVRVHLLEHRASLPVRPTLALGQTGEIQINGWS